MQAASHRSESGPRATLAFGLILLPCALLAMAIVLGFAIRSDADDILRGWRNPPHCESVRQWTATQIVHSEQAPSTGDFDGDGVDDVLENVYLHRTFLIAESTSGMVYVLSGADGTVLLAHPTPTPFTPPLWCADSDDDGADEVFVPDPPATMFAFERR